MCITAEFNTLRMKGAQQRKLEQSHAELKLMMAYNKLRCLGLCHISPVLLRLFQVVVSCHPPRCVVVRGARQ